jgi:hypothetical protein
LFTGFPLVIVDGRAPLSGELQEGLRRFLFAGGSLVVANPDKLPAGSLRDVAVKPGLRHGLGAFVALPRLDRVDAGLSALPPLGRGVWPANASALLDEQRIPGLGRAPVLVFLSIIIVFAVVAGPINFYLLRRRRRPLLVLVTVPLLGFGTTAAIIAFGLWHDGFGVRGVERSWTMLDQVRHEAVTISARTLFAGVAPNELIVAPDGFVLSPRALLRGRRMPDRWRYDAGSGRLDGGALPSRTATPLLIAQQGLVRERLRVRVQPDELVVLGDGGVAPVGVMVLRDLEGVYWLGTAPRLSRASPADAGAVLRRLRAAASAVELEPTADRASGSDEVTAAQLVDRLFADELVPGSYVAQVELAPWLDQQGLRVAYDAAVHFVSGRMHGEDFVP